MIIFVDIDETICNTPEDRNYSKSVPINKNIEKINKLYDEGNTIVYWTARGSGSGKDWHELTGKQFKKIDRLLRFFLISKMTFLTISRFIRSLSVTNSGLDIFKFLQA